MPEVKLVTIAEPKELTKTVVMGKAPFFIGQGDVDLVCGSCNNTLAQRIINGQLRDIIFKCPNCGVFCEQIPAPSFAVPENRIIGLAAGTFNLGGPIKCPPDAAIVGTVVVA